MGENTHRDHLGGVFYYTPGSTNIAGWNMDQPHESKKKWPAVFVPCDLLIVNLTPLAYTRWWFQIFFIFNPIWWRFPIWLIWLIFFKGVETTN